MGRQYHRMLPLVGVWRDCVTRLSASRHGSRGASRLVGAARTSYRHLHRCGWSDLWCSYGATLRRAVAKVLSPRRAVEKGFQHRLAVRQKHLAEGRREIAGFVDVHKPQRSGPCEPVPQITVGIDRTQAWHPAQDCVIARLTMCMGVRSLPSAVSCCWIAWAKLPLPRERWTA
jgi:hypothetical protein